MKIALMRLLGLRATKFHDKDQRIIRYKHVNMLAQLSSGAFAMVQLDETIIVKVQSFFP